MRASSGLEIECDLEDLSILGPIRWRTEERERTHYAKGDVLIDGSKRTIRMHQLVMGFPGEGLQVDHRDRNGLNNRRHNLRAVSHQVNQANRRPPIRRNVENER